MGNTTCVHPPGPSGGVFHAGIPFPLRELSVTRGNATDPGFREDLYGAHDRSDAVHAGGRDSGPPRPAARRARARTVHLRVEPGPLTITVLKRDLNIYENEDPLTVTLYDPLGNEVFAHTIPDDGNAGKGGRAQEYQRLEETVDCDLAGSYRLAIRGSSDVVWGVETSAESYVVEGEMFFSDGTVPGSVFFPPPAGAFTITISALHDPGRQTVPLFSAAGERLGQFRLTNTGEEYTAEFPEGEREGLWRMDFEALDVKLAVTGVTMWTAEEDAWFDAGKSKWMLMPYRLTRYMQPGESAELEFSLRNSTGAEDRLRLTPRAMTRCASRSSSRDAGGAQRRARHRCASGSRWRRRPARGHGLHVFLRASADGEPTAISSAGINIRVGETRSPAAGDADRAEAHSSTERAVRLRSAVCATSVLGLDNRPWIRQRTESNYGTTGVFTLTDDLEWVHRGEDAIRQTYPEYSTSYGGGGFAGAKIAFDGQGGLYTTLRLVAGGARPAVLLFSPDEGRSWEVHELRGNVADIEQFTGHNALDIPPPVLAYETTAPHPARFCAYNDLWLYMPRREGDRLIVGEPIRVAEAVIGSCQHSGGPPPV